MNALSNGSRFNLLPMNSISREMGRFFDELNGHERGARSAPVSVWQDDSNYYFEFDVPGVATDDLEVKVLENVLHVSLSSAIDNSRVYLRNERSFGSVERQFALPSRVDADNIIAELKRGVLRVSIAKAAEDKVKKIEIKSE